MARSWRHSSTSVSEKQRALFGEARRERSANSTRRGMMVVLAKRGLKMMLSLISSPLPKISQPSGKPPCESSTRMAMAR